MAVKTNQYASQIAQDVSRGPSQGIWFDCPLEDMIQAFGGGIGTAGYLVQDDFCPVASPSSAAAIGTLGQWACWAATGSTVLDAVEEGGVALINGTTTAKSLILTSNAGMFRMIGGSTAFNYTGGKFWMEARFALSTAAIAAGGAGFFFGLADNTGSQINSVDTTITAAAGDTLTTTKNVFGFYKKATTNPTDVAVVYQPAAGTAVYPTGLTTIVNDVTGAGIAAYAASTDKGKGTGFVKIGMVFDPTAGNPSVLAPTSPPAGQTAGSLYKPLVRFFVNGQAHAKFLNPGILQATTFPVNCVFSPVINYINVVGSTAGVYLDWVRFAQLATF